MSRRRGDQNSEISADFGVLITGRFWASLLCLVVLAGLVAGSAQSSEVSGDPGVLTAYPWLYLRGGRPVNPDEHVFDLIAVGDVMLGRGVAAAKQPSAFSGVAPWLGAADLTLANLECVVAEGGTARPGPYRLRAPLSAVDALHGAGIDLLGVANNHALDFGSDALAEMAGRLQDAGLAAVGAGADPGAAAQPVVRDLGGLRLAFLAFDDVPDPDDVPGKVGWAPAKWDPAQATAAVAAARRQADAVVVSIHWGQEYNLSPDPFQRTAAQALVDAGANLVIGHHPHVVQATEVYGGDAFVAYSLGNFVFDQQGDETGRGLALRALFDGEGLRAVQALPVWAGLHPRLMSPDEAAGLLARVQPAPRRAGFSCDESGCRAVDVPQSSANGLFRAGAIDLSGDGVPEQVQLVRGRTAIYSGGAEVWQSPPEWQVTDAALGDPNDDGRGELLVAFWGPDGHGVVGSHPFIVGYRSGAYRVLWGGSAVPEPIREVELGDVNGDEVQELIVLARQGNQDVLGVWRWYGWGFSEVWRSSLGHYKDLVLLPGQGATGRAISVGVLSAGR